MRGARQRKPGFSGAVCDNTLVFGSKLREWRIEIEASMPGESLREREPAGLLIERWPCRHGPLAKRESRVADQQAFVRSTLKAEPFASWTPAKRAVEGIVVRI